MWISRESALTVLKIGVSLVLNSLNNITFLLTGISVESIGKVFPALYLALAPRGTHGLPCPLPSEGCEGLGLQCCCTAGVDSRLLGKKETLKKVNPMGVFLRPPRLLHLGGRWRSWLASSLFSLLEDAAPGPVESLSRSGSHWDRPRLESGWSQRWVAAVMPQQSCSVSSFNRELPHGQRAGGNENITGRLFLAFYCEISKQHKERICMTRTKLDPPQGWWCRM